MADKKLPSVFVPPARFLPRHAGSSPLVRVTFPDLPRRVTAHHPAFTAPYTNINTDAVVEAFRTRFPDVYRIIAEELWAPVQHDAHVRTWYARKELPRLAREWAADRYGK